MTAALEFILADQALVDQIKADWSRVVGEHLVVDNGFSVVAVAGGKPVGLMGVYWAELPTPLEGTREGFINIIEVLPEYRGRGIAAEMVQHAIELSRKEGVYQIRAWSSDDKIQALPMWRKLGFTLCPADNPWQKGLKGYFVGYVL